MKADFTPDPNDINAPSQKEVEGFVAPKDTTWEDVDQEKFAAWDYVNKDLALLTLAVGAISVCQPASLP